MPDGAEGANSRAIFTRVVVCFFLSGATGLVYEVLWIRMLGLIFGHTVFAVTTVLSAFMAGLGLGSYLFGKIADRSRGLLGLYAALEAGHRRLVPRHPASDRPRRKPLSGAVPGPSSAYAGAGDFERAAEALTRAVTLDPFHPAVQRLSALRTLTSSTAAGVN